MINNLLNYHIWKGMFNAEIQKHVKKRKPIPIIHSSTLPSPPKMHHLLMLYFKQRKGLRRKVGPKWPEIIAAKNHLTMVFAW